MRSTVDKIRGLYPGQRIGDPTYQLSSLKYAPEMADVLWEAKRALERGVSPEKCDHGCSPTYFLKDCGHQPIAVFKLERCVREYAAFRLDHQGFAGVPPTVITALDHPLWGGLKEGSCQLFVPEAIPALQLMNKESFRWMPSPIRRVASLDIRIQNSDRHSSNLLFVNRQQAVPIDHGFILPRDLDSIHFVWLGWEQAKSRFSPKEKLYISRLDPEGDRRIVLDELLLPEKCANRLFVATVLLKLGMQEGLNPWQIGRLFVRGELRERRALCPFEELLETLKRKSIRDWTDFTRHVYEEGNQQVVAYAAGQY